MFLLSLILIATIVNSLVAFIGIFSIFLRPTQLSKWVFILVSFAAGSLFAGAFFHLLAESIEEMPVFNAFLLLFFGFILFFLLERILRWHHCHEKECDVHPVGMLILLGDSIHNFIDGLIIAASFFVSIPFGFITMLLIIFHEIPQELGDFGILIYSGFTRKKALIYNFLSQCTSILGGIIGFFLQESLINIKIDFLLPFAAGGFLYIALSDLVPEMHKEPDIKKTFIAFSFFLIGILLMIALKILVNV